MRPTYPDTKCKEKQYTKLNQQIKIPKEDRCNSHQQNIFNKNGYI